MNNVIFEKGQRVRFAKPPANPTLREHFNLSKQYLDLGKVYVVEHYFYGDPPQVELDLGSDDTPLFAADMFLPVD